MRTRDGSLATEEDAIPDPCWPLVPGILSSILTGGRRQFSKTTMHKILGIRNDATEADNAVKAVEAD